MAQRRMFSMKVVDTDAFCDMPSSAQNLYFHIGMRADDEGFYAGVRGLMAKIHASGDDLAVLIGRGYILDRGDGVYVVKHWKMNNYLQNDRIKPTEYEEKRIGIYTKRDGSYTLDPNKALDAPKPKCIQNVSIEESSVVKSSIEESSKAEDRVDSSNEKEKIKSKKYVYTKDQIEHSNIALRDCLRMRKRKELGFAIPEDWDNTLTDFAEEIRKAEEEEPF